MQLDFWRTLCWLKAFHIITVIWLFAGVVFIGTSGLFVYHAQSTDSTSIERF